MPDQRSEMWAAAEARQLERQRLADEDLKKKREESKAEDGRTAIMFLYMAILVIMLIGIASAR